MRLTRSWNAARALRFTLAGLAVITAPALAQAQQATVTGRVTAAGTGEPLVEARVMVANTSLIVGTNADGKYTIKNAPTGTFEVRVIRVGFQEQKKPVTVAAGGSATLDFQMQQAVVKLADVVTTATGDQHAALKSATPSRRWAT